MQPGKSAGKHLSQPRIVIDRKLRHRHFIEIYTVFPMKSAAFTGKCDQPQVRISRNNGNYVDVGRRAFEAVKERDDKPAYTTKLGLFVQRGVYLGQKRAPWFRDVSSHYLLLLAKAA